MGSNNLAGAGADRSPTAGYLKPSAISSKRTNEPASEARRAEHSIQLRNRACKQAFGNQRARRGYIFVAAGSTRSVIRGEEKRGGGAV